MVSAMKVDPVGSYEFSSWENYQESMATTAEKNIFNKLSTTTTTNTAAWT